MAPWRKICESQAFYIPMGEVIWYMSRTRMLILNIYEFRPSGSPSSVFEKMKQSSLARDVSRNRHEFALMH